MTQESESYNLLVKEWIPVLWACGKPGRVGIRTALTEARRIRQIAASNPMDNVALLRFLLAVLQWCKPSLDDKERMAIEGAEGISEDWLGRLGGVRAKFDLLGDGPRFYQDREVQATNDRPIGDLLQEFPTETKVAHFRHVRDGEYGLCPSCCAIGMVRFCAFANAYAGGRYTSAVNGPTPAYAIPQGPTLLQTLLLNWPQSASLGREPPWLCDQAPGVEDLDTVTVFAWRSRRVWLGDRGDGDEACHYCGRLARVIQRVAFTGNWKPPFQTKGAQKKFWDQDPHLILEEVLGKQSEAGEDADGGGKGNDQEAEEIGEGAIGRKATVTTLGFPAPGSRVATHARFWRRARLARLSVCGAEERREMPLGVSVAGPAAAANKGLYQDATAILLPAVPSGVHAQASEALKLLAGAVGKLMGALHQSTPNPKRQHPNRMAALDARSPSLERRLREEFDDWLRHPGSPAEGTPTAAGPWPGGLAERLWPVVATVVRATTPGSPLRRREAIQRAERALRQALDKLAKPAENSDTEGGEDTKHDSD